MCTCCVLLANTAAAQPEGHTVTIGPAVPPGLVKQESSGPQGEVTEETSTAVAAIGSGSAQGAEAGAGAESEGNMAQIGPMVSEMSHGDEVVQAAEEFERRSRKMKDHLTVKVLCACASVTFVSYLALHLLCE